MSPTNYESEKEELGRMMDQLSQKAEELKGGLMIERRKFNQAAENGIRGADQAFEATSYALRGLTKLQEEVDSAKW